MKLSNWFAALDDNLKLDPDERKRAQEVHHFISDVLVNAGIAKRSRLQGSFARKTMLPPLHDIDKVIELVDDLWEEFNGAAGPNKAMERIRAALVPEIPSALFEVKRHALGILLPDDGFDFDAVPAFNPEDGTGWIQIANTEAASEEGAWMRSNTYLLIDTISARNLACVGRFVRQVRMAKQIIHTAGIADSLPGLHVETFAYDAITEVMEHPDAVSATLAKACELLGGPYSDPTGADQISDRLDSWKIATAKAAMGTLSAQAAQAVQLAAGGDEAGAGRIWADLFGEIFPRPNDAEEKSFLKGLFTGGTVAATNRPAPSTRAWRP